MAVYTVTTSNWNLASFWAAISESGAGHTLDFSQLGAGFSVFVDQAAGTITVSDGSTTFTVGEAGVTGTDANLASGTLLDYFTTLSGSQGDDSTTGTAQADDLEGGGGADTLNGQDGDDNINGGAGADLLYGGDGDDQLSGGWQDNGADTIFGEGGNDLVFAYGGDDSVVGGDGGDWIDGGVGNDHLEGNAGNDQIIGDEGSDTILGGAGSDILSGGEGRDSIDGGDGSDAIWGNAGDTISGGEGGVDNDTLYVSYVDSINYTTAESGTITFNSGDTLSFSGIEQVIEQTPDGVVDGTAGDDQLGQFQYDADGDWIDNGDGIGEADGDSVRAGDGNDTIWAGDGDDTVHGEAGNDRIVLGGGNNVGFGGAGADTIEGEWQNDTISGDDYTTTGPNLIVNGSFEDTTGMTAVPWGYQDTSGSISGWTDANGADIDVVNSGRGGLNATDGANWLDMEGGLGEDLVISQSVAGISDGDVYVLRFDLGDLANGNDGTTLDNQLQVIWNGDVVGTIDALDGNWRSYEFNLIGGSGDGSNTLTFAGLGGADSQGASLDNVQMYQAVEAAGGDDSIVAAEGDDDLMGGAGNDTINAGSGNDEVVAGSGDDSVLGGWGHDEIRGNEGNDTLSGGEGDDSIFGGAGRDRIDGGAGDDSLVGGADNDIFYGSVGADTVVGGTGRDLYYVVDGFDGGVVDLGGDDIAIDGISGDELISFYDVSSAVDVTFTSATGGTAISAAGDALTFENADGFEGAVGVGGTFDASAAGFDVTFYDYGGMTSVTGSDYGDLLVAYGADPISITDRFYDGGAGDDTIDTGEGNDTILGGSGDDQIVAREGDDSVEGGAGNDTIFGGTGDDYLAGGEGSDSLLGGLGRDTIAGGEGADFIQGNEDSDLGDYSASDAAVTIVLDGGGAAGTASGGHAEGDTIIGIDDLLGSDFDDSLTGYDATHGGGISNMIDGGAGNDTIAGLGGDDSLMGGAGDDSIDGGTGDDTVIGGAGQDSVIGGDGADLLVGDDAAGGTFGVFALGSAGTGDIYNNGTFIFDSSAGSTTAQVTDDESAFEDSVAAGGSATDGGAPQILTSDLTIGSTTYLAGTVIYAIAQSDIENTTTGETGNAWLVHIGTVSSTSNRYWTFDIAVNDGDQINWTSSNTFGVQDQIFADATGLEYGDLVQADGQPSPSNDTLVGGAGNDTLIGGAGADSLNAGADNDSVDGGRGNDTIDAGTGNDTVEGGDGNDLVFGWTGDDSVTGGNGDDTIFGQDGNDTIYGGAGNDSLDGDDGAAGVDLIFGEDGNDTIIGDAGNDTLFGGAGDDFIFAGADDDSVTGDAGNDWISGEAGNDTFDGGTGDDTLLGGDGTDTFTYTAGDGNDTIADFNTGNTGTLSDGDSTNNDFINLSAFYDDIWELHADQADDGILNQSNDGVDGVDYANNTSFGSGSLTFAGASADNSSFTSENTGVVCFAQGTMILTPHGEVPVEHLRHGDLVVTRDNGVQQIVWTGCRDLSADELSRNQKVKPIWVSPELTGGDKPLIVSPQHGLLVRVDGAEETLVRATHLARMRGGKARVMRGCRGVSYHHLMFEAHEIIFANGSPAESFYPGPNAFGALSLAARTEVLSLFPKLNPERPQERYGNHARRFAKFGELPDSLAALSQVGACMRQHRKTLVRCKRGLRI